MTQLEELVIKLSGDNAGYLRSLKESESATRQTAARLEGESTQATKAVAAAQTQLASSYARTGRTAAATAVQQVQASKSASAAALEHAESMKRGAQITAASMTPLEQYRSRLSELNNLLKQGAISQETFSRAKQKAAQETGQQGAFQKLKEAFAAKASTPLGFAAIAVAVVKLTGKIAEAVTMTAKFRQSLLDIGHAGDTAARSMAHLTSQTTRQLARSDAPIAERRLQIEKKLVDAMQRRDNFRKQSEKQETEAQRFDANWSILGFNPLKHARPDVFAERDKIIEQSKKITQGAEADVEAIRKQKQELEESLRDAVFQEQSGARSQAALARVPEHLKGAARLRRMGADDKDVRETMRLSEEAMTTTFSADLDKAARSNERLAKNVHLTTAELQLLEAQMNGVSEAGLAMMKMAADRDKLAGQTLELARFNAGLKEEIASLGKTSYAAEMARRSMRGFSEAQLASTRALMMEKRGLELREQFLSPQQKYIRSMQELNELLQAGALDQLTYSRAANEARKALEGQRQELQAIQGAATGSAEAVERFNRFQDAIRVRPLPGFEEANRVVQAQQFRQAGGVFQGQAAGLGVGGVQAPQPVNLPPMQAPQNRDVVEVLREIRDLLRDQGRGRVNVGLGLGG